MAYRYTEISVRAILATGLTPRFAFSALVFAMGFLQSEPEAVDHLTNLLIVQLNDSRTCQNDKVMAGEIMLMLSERFADQAFNLVAIYR